VSTRVLPLPSFRYKALIFIADVKRKLINEADFSKQMKDENIILLYCGYQDKI
jgi:hypothetical protein